MKASELRIGNLVNSESCFTNKLTLYNLIQIEMNPNHPYKPIPLTEEWLLKFGFKDSQNMYDNRWETEDGFEIEIQGKDYAYCIWGGEDAPATTHFIGHCQHVHQLQNLYFALTGEELIITD